MDRQKIRKVIWKTALVVFILFIGIIVTCNVLVYNNGRKEVFSTVDSKPNNMYGVGLLFGTTPYNRIGHDESLLFKYRIEAALKLYHTHKVNYFLISGNKNGIYGINEPQCMKDSLVVYGIPPNVIYLDEEGNSTIEAIYRINKKYCLRTFVIIS